MQACGEEDETIKHIVLSCTACNQGIRCSGITLLKTYRHLVRPFHKHKCWRKHSGSNHLRRDRVSLFAKPSATKKPLLRLRDDGLDCRVPGIVAGCGERCETGKTIYENSLMSNVLRKRTLWSCNRFLVTREALGCHGSVANEAVQGDLGWSSFEAREAASKIVYDGRLRHMDRCRWVRSLFIYLHMTGVQTRWRRRLYQLDKKFGFFAEPVNVLTEEKWEAEVRRRVREKEALQRFQCGQIRGKHFKDGDQVIAQVERFLNTQYEEFYNNGYRHVVNRWKKWPRVGQLLRSGGAEEPEGLERPLVDSRPLPPVDTLEACDRAAQRKQPSIPPQPPPPPLHQPPLPPGVAPSLSMLPDEKKIPATDVPPADSVPRQAGVEQRRRALINANSKFNRLNSPPPITSPCKPDEHRVERDHPVARAKMLDEEDDLSEVQPDAVPNEVREWLASTFTRQAATQRKRSEDKPRFRSVANAIRAGIMVDRIYRRMSSSTLMQIPSQIAQLLK
ncbi:hypothetical protein HPB47_002047, partial [Ixodes persulcatus]